MSLPTAAEVRASSDKKWDEIVENLRKEAAARLPSYLEHVASKIETAKNEGKLEVAVFYMTEGNHFEISEDGKVLLKPDAWAVKEAVENKGYKVYVETSYDFLADLYLGRLLVSWQTL